MTSSVIKSVSDVTGKRTAGGPLYLFWGRFVPRPFWHQGGGVLTGGRGKRSREAIAVDGQADRRGGAERGSESVGISVGRSARNRVRRRTERQ